MATIETFYLVDYENVQKEGLICDNNLTRNDHVHLFTSKNAPHFNISTLAKFNNTNLYFHEVPASRQSVDMNLVSFLGYLIAKNETANCRYIIISKDTDYDNVITFWLKWKHIVIERREKIKQEPIVIESTETVEYNGEIYRYSPFPCSDQLSAEELVAMLKRGGLKPLDKATLILTDEVQKILTDKNVDTTVITFTSSLVTKYHAVKDCKTNIYRSLVKEYGQQEGLKIYNLIKKKL